MAKRRLTKLEEMREVLDSIEINDDNGYHKIIYACEIGEFIVDGEPLTKRGREWAKKFIEEHNRMEANAKIEKEYRSNAAK